MASIEVSTRRAFLPALILLLASAPAWAIDKTWIGPAAGTWGTGANWAPAGVPGNADRAILNAGATPVVAANATVDQLVVNAGATLTVNTGVTLTVDGGAQPFISGTGSVVSLGTGLLQVNSNTNNATIINSSITLGNFTVTSTANRNFGISSGVTVTVNGNLSLINSGDLRLGAAGGAASVLDVNGNVAINGPTVLQMRADNCTLRVSGNWTQTGAFLAGVNSTVIFDGAGAQTIDVERNSAAETRWENLRVTKPSGTWTYQGNAALAGNGFDVDHDFILDSAPGVVAVVSEPAILGTAAGDVFGIGSGVQISFPAGLDPDGDISFNIDGGADNGLLIFQGATLPPSDSSDFGLSLDAGAGTVRIQTNANDTFELDTPGNFVFWNLVIDTDDGGGQVNADVVTLTAGCTIANDLTLIQGQLSIGAFTVVVGGDIDSSNASESQLDFTAVGTLQVAGNVDLDSYSQINSGTLPPFPTLWLNGTAPQTFQIRATTASQFHDIDAFRVSNPAGVTVLNNPNADFIVNDLLTLDVNARLTIQDTADIDGRIFFVPGGGNLLRFEGDIVNDNTELGDNVNAGTGTIVYAGQGISQTVYTRINGSAANPIVYHHLTIDNTGAGVATQENPGLLDVNGTFTIAAADAAFTATAGNMTVAGSFIDNGTFTHGSATVTMNGTGSVSGTSPALLFNRFLVDTNGVVSAARSFSVQSTFEVDTGTFTTAGAPGPITMSALSGMFVGNGPLTPASAIFELAGPATLAVQPNQSFVVDTRDGRFVTSRTGGTPTLTRIGGAGSFDTLLAGQIEIRGLNFSFGNADGLEIAQDASVLAFRDIAFSGHFGAAGARFVTIRHRGMDLDCPGCTFTALAPGQVNVYVEDTAGPGAELRVRFEDRGDAPAAGGGGPGAGEAFDADNDANDNGLIEGPELTGPINDGAIVQWVYTANIDLGGAVQGFPLPAWDWNTFLHYSTYVVGRDGSGNADKIWVLNAEGDPKGYSFTSPAGTDIVGPLWWDTEGLNTHVLYVIVNDAFLPQGRIHKLIDTGAALVAAPFPWDTPFTHLTLNEVTSPLISDQVSLYFGGRNGAVNGIYRIRISDKTMPAPAFSTAGAAVRTQPSWANTASGRLLYFATEAAAGTSSIYRFHGVNWTLDASYNSASFVATPDQDCTTSIVATTNLPADRLYVGETNGFFHALPALGTPAQFVVPVPGFPFRDQVSAIRGGAIWENTANRIFFGNDSGRLYTLRPGLYAGSWIHGTNFHRFDAPGATAIRKMPLYLDGLLYSGSTSGRFYLLDGDTGAGQALLITYQLGTSELSDVARDFNTGRVYVGNAQGRIYSIPDAVDPTVPK